MDPTLAEDLFIVWSQTELTYSLVSATIPSLRPFLRDLTTFYGGALVAQSADGLSNQAYAMSNIKSHETSARRDDASQSRTVYEGPATRTKNRIVSEERQRSQDQDKNSLWSQDSRQMIISKKQTWAIAHDGPSYSHM